MKQHNLDVVQMQAIARLSGDPGYELLLNALQSDLDDLSDDLEQVADANQVLTTLARWQALRHTIKTLRGKPKEILESLNEELTHQGEDPAIGLTMTPELKARLYAEWLRRQKEKTSK